MLYIDYFIRGTTIGVLPRLTRLWRVCAGFQILHPLLTYLLSRMLVSLGVGLFKNTTDYVQDTKLGIFIRSHFTPNLKKLGPNQEFMSEYLGAIVQ